LANFPPTKGLAFDLMDRSCWGRWTGA